MSTAKAPGSYHHGDVVIIPLRVWSIIASHSPVAKWRIEARTMGDAELYAVLNDLWAAYQEHLTASNAPMPRTTTRARREWLTVAQAATTLGIKERGVRDACERKRLTAEKIAGRWHIDPDSVASYKAA